MMSANRRCRLAVRGTWRGLESGLLFDGWLVFAESIALHLGDAAERFEVSMFRGGFADGERRRRAEHPGPRWAGGEPPPLHGTFSLSAGLEWDVRSLCSPRVRRAAPLRREGLRPRLPQHFCRTDVCHHA